jgi:flavin reductase (DIM6/NTAB) family NADH-FMN oxidoreductase RutF
MRQTDAAGGPSRDAFIAAMRRVASSISVVTTDGPAGRHGATVSAFCSVSADPPAVLVCLNAASRIARAVAANGRFAVNVLPEGGPALAERFAGRDDHRLADRFSGVDCHGRPGTPPALDGATVFECRAARTVAEGSHMVVIGHVDAVRPGAPRPLMWLDGGYHHARPAPRPEPARAAGAGARASARASAGGRGRP